MATHRNGSWRRITGVLGILFFITFVVGLFGLIIPVQPGPEDSIQDVRSFFADDGDIVYSANWIITFAVVMFFVPFASGLRTVLSADDPDDGMWTRTSFGSAVALAAVGVAGSAFIGGAAIAHENGALEDSVLRYALYTDAILYGFGLTFMAALFLGSTSIAILRTRALPGWLAGFGLIIATVGLVGAWWPVGGDVDGAWAGMSYASGPFFALWCLLAGVQILRGAGSESQAELNLTESSRASTTPSRLTSATR